MKKLFKLLKIKLIVFLAPFTLANNGQSQGVKFFDRTLQECIEYAEDVEKYVFIDGYTDWCSWCKVMDKKTFSDQLVGEFYNNNFVAIKMNMEEGEGLKIKMKYRIKTFPTYLYFKPNGDLVKKVVGYMDPIEFIDSGKSAMKLPKNKYFSNNLHNLKMPYPLFFRLANVQKNEIIWPRKDTILNFLKIQSDLFSEVSWTLMYRFGLDSALNQFFLVNKEKYSELYGQDEINNKTSSIIFNLVYQAVEDNSEVDLNKALILVDKHLPKNKESTKQYYTTYFYQETGNWEKYARSLQKEINLNGYTDLDYINNGSWNIYLQIEDKTVISQAVEWMSKVTKQSPEFYYLDTYAHLLYKSGDLTKAKEIANKAIEAGKLEGEDVKLTKKLLKEIKEAK